MKRDYKFFSVFIIFIIQVLTGALIGGVLSGPIQRSAVVSILVSLAVSLLGSVFTFTIAGGLLRDRMGSVSDYLNQVNYINGRVITVAFLVSIITTIVTRLFQFTGGMSLVSSFMSPNSSAVFAIGAILLPLILMVVSYIVYLFFSYTYLYLADTYDKKESVGSSIKNIFAIGNRLFKRTFVMYLKYIILPSIAFLLITIGAVIALGDPGLIVLFIGLIIYLFYVVIVYVVTTARLSDIYLDYKESLEESI